MKNAHVEWVPLLLLPPFRDYLQFLLSSIVAPAVWSWAIIANAININPAEYCTSKWAILWPGALLVRCPVVCVVPDWNGRALSAGVHSSQIRLRREPPCTLRRPGVASAGPVDSSDEKRSGYDGDGSRRQSYGAEMGHVGYEWLGWRLPFRQCPPDAVVESGILEDVRIPRRPGTSPTRGHFGLFVPIGMGRPLLLANLETVLHLVTQTLLLTLKRSAHRRLWWGDERGARCPALLVAWCPTPHRQPGFGDSHSDDLAQWRFGPASGGVFSTARNRVTIFSRFQLGTTTFPEKKVMVFELRKQSTNYDYLKFLFTWPFWSMHQPYQLCFWLIPLAGPGRPVVRHGQMHRMAHAGSTWSVACRDTLCFCKCPGGTVAQSGCDTLDNCRPFHTKIFFIFKFQKSLKNLAWVLPILADLLDGRTRGRAVLELLWVSAPILVVVVVGTGIALATKSGLLFTGLRLVMAQHVFRIVPLR